MNDGCSRLDDDRDLIAVAVDEPVEGHVASFSSPWLRTTDAPRHRLFGAPGQSSKEGLNEKEYVLFMQQIIRKANHGALKNPLFRCVIVSVPAFCHWSERTPLGPSLWCKLSGGLHHAEDSNCAGCILGDAERCRRCRPASQGAAASGGSSGWQVAGRQGSDWQNSTSSARRDQGLTVCSLTLERLSGLDTHPITTLMPRRGLFFWTPNLGYAAQALRPLLWPPGSRSSYVSMTTRVSRPSQAAIFCRHY